MISRKHRTDRWELTVPSVWPLIAAKDSLFLDQSPDRYRGDENGPKNETSLAAIRAQKEGARIGGELVTMAPGSSVNRGPIVGD